MVKDVKLKEKNGIGDIMKKVLKGKIRLIEQEGGYCSPVIEIGGEYLDNILLDFPHKEMTSGIDIFDKILEGKYKITIERIK